MVSFFTEQTAKYSKPQPQHTYSIPTNPNDRAWVDGKIDASFQGNAGDCYLLSTLTGASKTKEGQKQIKNSVFRDPITNLVGVQLQGTKNKHYFTDKEIRKEEGNLSYGDDDARVIEMGFKKERETLIASLNYIKTHKSQYPSQLSKMNAKDLGINDEKNPINGGNMFNTAPILFKNAKVKAYKNLPESGRIQDYGDLSEHPMAVSFKEDKVPISNNMVVLNRLNRNDDGVMYSNHSYTVVGEDENNITIINPWNSLRETKISKKDFRENVQDIEVIDFKEEESKPEIIPQKCKNM